MLKRIPIVGQVLAVVILATVLSSGAMVWLTLKGPPPREPPRPLAELSALLDGRQPKPREGSSPARVSSAIAMPDAPAGYRRNRALEARLASELAVPADELVAFTQESLPPAGGNVFGPFRIARELPEGRWRVVDSGADANLSRWRRVTLITIGAVFGFVVLVGWLLASGIARPIRRLGKAASEARQSDIWTLEIPDGPPEIREAAIALRDLHRRTAEASSQRLTMLGAIAHDIGTPLARLAFRVEKLEAGDRKAAQGDIDTMQRLLSDSLTLARGWHGEAEPLDLADLVARLVAREAAAGREVTLARKARAPVLGHPLSLERMAQNLIDNALRYGGRAEVMVGVEGRHALLCVRDQGPGFAGLDVAELCKPYVRGEHSRNPATGGSGLGLAIVTQVVERHGGEMVLGDRGEGGAEAIVRLPLAAERGSERGAAPQD